MDCSQFNVVKMKMKGNIGQNIQSPHFNRTTLRIKGKEMNKKILIVSIIAVAILLLMPSIPAIQQNVIEDKAYSDFIEQLDFNDITELIESGKLDNITHPILYVVLTIWLYFRLIRAGFLIDISSDSFGFGGRTVHYPLIYIRGVWLAFTCAISLAYLQELSYKYGWNWEIFPY